MLETVQAQRRETAPSALMADDEAHRRPQRAVGRVVVNRPMGLSYFRLDVAAPAPMLAARPGQFFHLRCPPRGDQPAYLRRPMSLFAADPEGGRLSFLIKLVGKGTRALAGLGEGDQLDMVGPLGNGFALPRQPRHLLLVGRGCGLATLFPLAKAGRALGARVTALVSLSRPGSLAIEPLFAAEGAETLLVTDADGSSDPARVEGLLKNLPPVDAAYSCGSNRLAALLAGLCKDWRIQGQVALEEPMACGLGACLGCVHPFREEGNTVYRRVCVEGPVFDLSKVHP
ncbi:MAG: dihydroorotate dehydrogenase electron transfer subunit [Rhodospirillales bacterium]|nr:dihydroorotate dehydrogenase electron transfer subunit [Rhodospirillales bacterium]